MINSRHRPAHFLFHRVAYGDSHYTNIDPDAFAGTLDVIKENCTTLRLAEAQESVWDRTVVKIPGTRRRVLLSFDDGFADLFDHAVPNLLERNLNAAFFVVSGSLGGVADWGRYSGGSGHPRLMSLSQVRELVKLGFEIGSHGMTHVALTGRSDENLRREIIYSRRMLEDALGSAVRFFSFPFGQFDRHSLELAAATYAASFSTVRSQIRDWRPVPHGLRRTYFHRDFPPKSVLDVIDAFTVGDDYANKIC